MKIVLRADVETLGKKGDLLDVANGYARNFLVPRGLAIVATKGTIKQSVAMRRSREVKDSRDRDSAQAMATTLTASAVQITARAGEGGKLFGSVTSSDVAAALGAVVGFELDRRKVELAEPLKALGPAVVTVRLHPDVVATVSIEVIAE
ncbi:MAG: 50S ribosomal protein L9 [Acidimicrobiia bacterium]|nr:50S ribosomal protein L9 [Acidimicrobiia bacterium]